MPGDDPNIDLGDLDEDEAAELAAHLKKMRAKKELKAKLAAAEEAAAKLKAELAGLDNLEITEDTRASTWDAPLAEREALARAARPHGVPDETWSREAKGVEAELARSGAIEGIMPPEHGRTARQNSEGQHAPGGLSAESRLPRAYASHVRVIDHRFKHRARNGRTIVDDNSLQRLKEKHPDWDWDS